MSLSTSPAPSALSAPPALPTDILRLLPQWFDIDTCLQLLQVCKLWRKLFALPSSVSVILEYWDTESVRDVTTATLLFGSMKAVTFPSSTMIEYSIGKDYNRYYRLWMTEVPLKEALRVISGARHWSTFPSVHEREQGDFEPSCTLLSVVCVDTEGIDTTPYFDYLSSDATALGYEYCHLVSSKAVSPFQELELYIEMGPFTPEWDVPPLPDYKEYSKAFLDYQVEDVGYAPFDTAFSCLVLDRQGVCRAVLYYQDILQELESPESSEYEHYFYIWLRTSDTTSNDDMPYLWESNLNELDQRIVDYVVSRLRELGLLE